ncbi:PAS domain S-box protein [Nitrospira sp. Nam80]
MQQSSHVPSLSGGEMERLICAHDWTQSPLGAVQTWPVVLASTLNICLSARFPMAIYWGDEGFLLYNDAWRPILGRKHPWAIGRPARQVWPEIWDAIAPLFESVRTTGQATWRGDELLPMQRFGYTEECYFDYTFNPIRGENGTVVGVLNVVQETTYRVLNERRTKLLRELASQSGSGRSEREAGELALSALASNMADIPFALLYLVEAGDRQARLMGTTGLSQDSRARPGRIDLTTAIDEGTWPVGSVLRGEGGLIVENVTDRFGPLPGGQWPEPTTQALMLPVTVAGQPDPAAVLVVGVNPRHPLDDDYRHFLQLVASHIGTALTNARAYASEKRRAEALAELDRAKTVFFSNVSHEFRTPLTLMLGPLEEELRERPDALRLEIAHRNSLRLLRLVNQLLDFSSIEAGRTTILYEPTDLAAFTADLAGVFRSAVEKAGLTLIVYCSPLSEAVYVDRDMWEKIVLNLLSNALKFTFEGTITVTLRPVSLAGQGEEDTRKGVELSVQDTGTGISPDELPRLFNRFHRVKGARSRTHEGTGIGLALVQELVKLHGGSVRVESVPQDAAGEPSMESGLREHGSIFAVTVPLGLDHLPPDRIGAGENGAVVSPDAGPYAEEALRWLPDSNATGELGMMNEESRGVLASAHSSFSTQQADLRPAARPRVLVVDDNADMREYVTRLLDAAGFKAVAACDGEAALEAARRAPPDLVLSDIMMPRLDGLGLLLAMRADSAMRTIPVILLSARAGEEARVGGLDQGADDYLIKPFSARELLARVRSHLDMARRRREAQAEISRSKLFLERIAASTPDMLFVFDIIEGRNIYVNRSVESVMGHTAEGLRSMAQDPTDSLVHPDDLAGVKAWYASFNDVADDDVLEHEHRIRHVDGSYRRLLARAAVFERTSDGRAKQIIGVASDVTERRRADEARSRLAAIVESSGDAIVSKGLDGIIRTWNAGAERLFGYTAEEAIGKPITMLMPPDLVHEEAGILERIGRGERIQHFETIRRRKDGKRVDISLTISPIVDARGRVVGASKIARDITEHKRQEQALVTRSRQQRLLYDLAEAVNRAGVLADLYDKALDAIIHSLNADRASILLFEEDGVMRFKASRGLSEQYRRAVEGHSPWRRDSCSPRPMVMGDIAAAKIEEGLRSVIRREGIQALSFIPLMYGGRLLGKFMVYFNHPHVMNDEEIDLAQAIAGTLALGIERTIAEQSLRRSEERLRLAMAASCMGAWDIELATGTVTWDAKQCDLYGLPRDAAVKTMDELYASVHPDDVARVKQGMVAATASGQFYMEFRIIRRDGLVRWIVGHGATVMDDNGCATRMVGVNYDITEQKGAQSRLQSFAEKLEATVQRRTEELSHSQQRLRALAAELNLAEQRERQRVATDLHDYLAQLLALSKIKLAQAKRHDMLPPVEAAVSEVQQVLDQALTYTRTLVAELSPPMLQEFGLSSALNWLVEQMKLHNLNVTLDMEASLPSIPEDQARLLFQSIRELLINITKHGHVNEATVRVAQAQGNVRIAVIDQGAGFDLAAAAAAAGTITPHSSKFGLFSIRERMTALGGEFHLDSAPGKGTTATLMLPLTPKTAKDELGMLNEELEAKASGSRIAPDHGPQAHHSSLPIDHSSVQQDTKQIRVLLVDDHAMVRQGLRGLLEAYVDIHIIGEAANGEEAVALAEKLEPDVILMDINMPQMDGIEATRRIVRASAGIGVIALSLQTAGQAEAAVKEAGAVAFINKEAAVEDLYQTIQIAVPSSRRWDHPG